MPRIARGNLEQGFFHVLNRGNHRQMLFRKDEHFAVLVEVLTHSISQFKIKLWSYCLMRNHWHLVAEVAATKELSR
jgi:putative transposase